MGGVQSSSQTTVSETQTAFDPRSPSDAIQRTPVRLSGMQLPEDPRSPSQRIDRTPLQIEQENKANTQLEAVKKTLDYDNLDNSRMPLVSRNV